jgi:hypothetical protein
MAGLKVNDEGGLDIGECSAFIKVFHEFAEGKHWKWY